MINGTDWFCFFDESQQIINRTQTYTLMGYQPFVFVSTHLLFGSFTRGRILYPSTHMEKKNAVLKSQNVVSSMISDMSPHARAFVSTSNLVRPLYLRCMTPSLFPFSKLDNISEKMVLAFRRTKKRVTLVLTSVSDIGN